MTDQQELTPAMIQITGDNGQHLGWARNVIDLSNDEPEVRIEQIAPGLSRTISKQWLPMRVGHVLGSVLDPDMYIATDGIVYPPEQGRFLNAECPDCDSALVVLPNNEPGVLWFVIEHRESCPAILQWIADQR